MTTTSLKVLLVSSNQALLRSLSKIFDLLELDAVQVVDPRLAHAAASSQRPDILILDGALLAEGGRELCRAVCGGGMHSHVYTLLMLEMPAQVEEMVEALKLGADDFLVQPIVFGELLARLRAAVRGLEYERRVQDYLGTDPLSGLANASAFRQAAAAALDRSQAGSDVACVAVDLDFFHRLNYMYGRPEADEVLRGVAKLLQKSCKTNDLPATAGDDRFWVLLPDHNEAQAGQWAEQFRAVLADAQFSLGAVAETITASFGVAAGQAGGLGAAELIEQADFALQTAKRSGRNCVVLRTTLNDESNAWTNLGGPGKLFDRTVARDVMSACTITLRPDDHVYHVALVLEQGGQEVLPVVDHDGKLLGLITAEELQPNATRPTRGAELARDVMNAEPVEFAETTTFNELVAFFSEDARTWAVVVEGGKPTGIVTRNSLAALSEPLATDSFAPDGEFEPTSRYLLVRDAAGGI